MDDEGYTLKDDRRHNKPGFMEVEIDPDATLAFQVKYGEPLA
jgi:hypothetical protein